MDRLLVRRIALAAAALVALAAIGLGIRAAVGKGAPAEHAAVTTAPPPFAMPAPGAKAPSLDVSAQRLAARLESAGSTDPAEWELLGKAWLELQRPEEAAKAFERARRLRGAGGATSVAR
jgi:cytochrome c-type biogenesis protein CcmH/NrfG